MADLLIKRFADHPQLGCPGELVLDNVVYGMTMEREYQNNKPISVVFHVELINWYHITLNDMETSI